jgi:hypothetical protein
MNTNITLDNTLIAKTGAALLSSIGKIVNAWSMIAAFVALIVISVRFGDVKEDVLFTVSLLIALLQAYFAARCAFDAAIFASLGGDIHQYEGFDRLSIKWKLRRIIFVTQSVEQRVQGALRLLRWQIGCFCLQILSMFAGIIFVHF